MGDSCSGLYKRQLPPEKRFLSVEDLFFQLPDDSDPVSPADRDRFVGALDVLVTETADGRSDAELQKHIDCIQIIGAFFAEFPSVLAAWSLLFSSDFLTLLPTSMYSVDAIFPIDVTLSATIDIVGAAIAFDDSSVCATLLASPLGCYLRDDFFLLEAASRPDSVILGISKTAISWLYRSM